LVARATIRHLDLPQVAAWVVAVTIEGIGIISMAMMFSVYQFNQERRKTDPPISYHLPAGLIIAYLLLTLGLAVIVDIVPALAFYLPAFFPPLALTGFGARSLGVLVANRQRMIVEDRTQKKVDRQERLKERRNQKSEVLSRNLPVGMSEGAQLDTQPDTPEHGQKLTKEECQKLILSLCRERPNIAVAELGRQIGRSRETTYAYLDELVQDGLLTVDGKTKLVVEKGQKARGKK